MKIKIFRNALMIAVALSISTTVFAQAGNPEPNEKALAGYVQELKTAMNDLGTELKVNSKDLSANYIATVNIKGLHYITRPEAANAAVSEEKTKTYSKTYTIDANDKLQIDNKYGKVTINTWNHNEFKVDIQIKVSSSRDGEAQKYIDGITISDNKDGDVVSFATHFGQYSSQSGWSLWSTNSKRNIEVNYVVYMPSKNQLDITNRYGATILPDFDGKLSIDNAYGNFDAQALTHADNQIKLRYGSANIENFASGDIDVAYGNLDIGSADKLSASVSYGSVKISKIKSTADINARYAGSVKISELDKNFSNLSYNGSYSGIKVGMNNVAADFDITVHYGSFSFGDIPVNVTEKNPPDSHRGFSSTQNYKGHVGKGNTDRVISIRSSFGSVQFE